MAKDPSIEGLEYTARWADGRHEEHSNTTEIGSRWARFGIAGRAGYSAGRCRKRRRGMRWFARLEFGEKHIRALRDGEYRVFKNRLKGIVWT